MNAEMKMAESISKLRFLIAAGGTGGHLFPAMAVVEQLEEMHPKAEFQFIGSADRIESRIVPEKGYKFHTINVQGFHGLSTKTLKLPLQVFSSVLKSRKIIKNEKIDAVICAGAYLSYPPGTAAKQAGIPLFLMESNVNPGKAIQMLSGKADLIFTAFPESDQYFPEKLRPRLRPYGNPVRKMMSGDISRAEAREKFGLDPGKMTILIFGGSLGAKSINNAMMSALKDFAGSEYQVIWQTGKLVEPSNDLPGNIKSMQFIDDMATAYAASDLVICRSGATTVAELCAIGKPAVLVPLPSASNNEQYLNAKLLDEKKAAIMITDSRIGDLLFAVTRELIRDQRRLEDMTAKAKSLGKPLAAENCAKEILYYMEDR